MKPIANEGKVFAPKRKSQWGYTILLFAGVLLLLAFIILPIVLFMAFAPLPRDQKSVSLDNDDFGLGFRVGDAWDLMGFEKMIEKSGVEVIDDIRGHSPDPFDADFRTRDMTMLVGAQADSDDVGKLGYIFIGMDVRRSQYNLSLLAEAKKKYPDDKYKRFEFITNNLIEHIATQYPRLRTLEGVGVGSSMNDIITAYGQPFMNFPEVRGVSLIEYLGEKQWITFSLRNGRVQNIFITPGLSSRNADFKMQARIRRMTSPFITPIIKHVLEKALVDDAAKVKSEGSRKNEGS
jgi:hypothetical protein